MVVQGSGEEMRVSEVFYSISGEGIHAGIPTVFVRLTGCNLRCSYCDTKYAQNLSDGEEMSIRKVMSCLQLNPFSSILITGGEPLFQADEVSDLLSLLRGGKRLIELETNGSIDPPLAWFNWVDCWSVDVKCPSSGSSYGSFRERWLRRMRKQDQLKFVVGTEEDLDFVRGFLNSNGCRAQMLVSPVMPSFHYEKFSADRFKAGEGTVFPDEDLLPILRHGFWLQEVAEFCKEQNVRMSLQLHKVIWGDKKGV